MRQLIILVICLANIARPDEAAAGTAVLLGQPISKLSRDLAISYKSSFGSYASPSSELASAAKELRKYVSPKGGVAGVGLELARHQSKGMKIDLRGGVSKSIRNPRAGIQLNIIW